VITVKGPIDPAALGMTLPHEHLFMDFSPLVDTPDGWREVGEEKPATPDDIAFFNAPLTIERIGAATMGRANRDNRVLNDEATAIKEVTDYKWAGGGTLVDVTTIGIKPNPEALKRVADATGVNIIMGSGWYEHGYVGNVLDNRTVASMADEIVHAITVGAGDTGIRAGIIGEIGVKNPRREYEKKILGAAVNASLRTGAAISIHMARGFHEQVDTLKFLKASGADLRRVAMGHSNPIADNMPLMQTIVKQGAFIQFDLLGEAPHILSEVPDHDVAVAIMELIKQGYVSQILLSQDVCLKVKLKAYGGSGYSYVADQFIPYLKHLGATDEQITQMVVTNPRRLLTLVEPRPVPGKSHP
jgi:phosphotriesterase-related protein